MNVFRIPVSCIVAAAAAFHGGMPPAAAAIAEAVEVQGHQDAVKSSGGIPAQGAMRGRQDDRSSGPHPSAAADEWGTQTDERDAQGEVEAEEAVQPVAVALEREVEFQEVVVGPGGVVRDGGGEVAGEDGRLIYSNTLGISAINFPTNQPVSDDIATTAPDGCRLTSFKFKVLGKVITTGASGPFTVTYGLYTNCPLAVGTTIAQHDLVKIPGTDGVLSFADEGPRTIKHVVDPHHPVSIPTNVYLGLQFNRGNCGTIVGAPATIGFSGDVFDHPVFHCNASLGGFPQLPHASFWLEVYGDAACPASFPGYKCARASGPTALLGAGVQGVDDIKLQVEDCQMVSYEVAVRGVGFYNFDLRRQCDGQIIPGTERTFQINASTVPVLQLARFPFNPPIQLLDDDLFLGFKSSSNSSCAVIAGISPVIGESSPDYFKIGFDGCEPVLPTSGVHGAINLAITCAGDLPLGACCDMGLLECQGVADQGKRCHSNADCADGTCESTCRQLSQMNCPRSSNLPPPWVQGASCASSPFPHSCGLSACCLPDDTCENLTFHECQVAGPIEGSGRWDIGRFCGESGQKCEFSACDAQEGNCFEAHDWGGCSNPFCCDQVCSNDSWCCHVEWDRQCVDEADQQCLGSPGHDHCWDPHAARSALLVAANSVTSVDTQYSTEDETDPDLACAAGAPRAQGYGTSWLKFIASHESVQVATCNSDPKLDSLVGVFAAKDRTTPQSSCQSLALIGCGDDGCSEGCVHSQFCVNGLTPGDTYYLMLGSKFVDLQGVHEVEIQSPCPDVPGLILGDCNQNNVLDSCEIDSFAAEDCNRNGVPDGCDIDQGISRDCDGNMVPDECFKLIQSIGGRLGDEGFGTAISMHGDILVVGSDQVSENSACRGAVYVFRKNVTAWDLETRLCPTLGKAEPRPKIGVGLAAGASQIAIGSTLEVVGEVDAAGAVYVFQHEGERWIQAARLTSEKPQRFAGLGQVVAMSRNRIASSEGTYYTYTVQVFQRTASVWHHETTIAQRPHTGNMIFGAQLALDGDVLVVGADGIDVPNAFYVYERNSVGWQLVQVLGLPDLVLGSAMSLSGKLIAVYSFTHFDWHIHVFERNETHWDLSNTLVIPKGLGADLADISLRKDTLVVSTDASHNRRSEMFAFQRVGTDWLPIATVGPCAVGGQSIAVSPPWVAYAGSPCPEPAVSTISIFEIDCNQNGEADFCDHNDGQNTDCDENGIIDECEMTTFGDADKDGGVDFRDFAALQRCYLGGGEALAACCGVFDAELRDGDADLVDFAAFVGAMTGP